MGITKKISLFILLISLQQFSFAFLIGNFMLGVAMENKVLAGNNSNSTDEMFSTSSNGEGFNESFGYKPIIIVGYNVDIIPFADINFGIKINTQKYTQKVEGSQSGTEKKITLDDGYTLFTNYIFYINPLFGIFAGIENETSELTYERSGYKSSAKTNSVIVNTGIKFGLTDLINFEVYYKQQPKKIYSLDNGTSKIEVNKTSSVGAAFYVQI